ncbi:hypothetical protein GCM10009687_46990 [Asanoa iriomotensis]|uniref:Uncharacterized protein n=1 Tax=Asanoa iriomotensis TaxID=234613 RepID=A0ABQ4BXJ8_9ACTN|nr:hypothetical protein Air01nite_13570 [Asanoa iriomotensis]
MGNRRHGVAALWYDGGSELATTALDRLKRDYGECRDLAERSVPDCCEVALEQGSVAVAVTSERSAWLAFRLLSNMVDRSDPDVLVIVTLNPDQLSKTLQAGPDGPAVAGLLSVGRLTISDILQKGDPLDLP